MSAVSTDEMEADFVLAVDPRDQSSIDMLVFYLEKSGFSYQIRDNYQNNKLYFVKLKEALLIDEMKKENMNEYLLGVTTELLADNFTPTKAEKLRISYAILTKSLTPSFGEWSFVQKIMPIYSIEEEKRIFSDIVAKNSSNFYVTLNETDILKIKSLFGEQVALYFGFLRYYTLWLIFPSIFGLISYIFFKRFSIIFTILNLFLSIIFINLWNKKQTLYSIQWNTINSTVIDKERPQYKKPQKADDSNTEWIRILKEIAFAPVAILTILILVIFQFFCFVVEIFLNEIYKGAGKQFLSLVPTVLIVSFLPILTIFYTKLINLSLNWENHKTFNSYNQSSSRKMFILNFFSSYMPLIITSFVYLPFGHLINNYLSIIHEQALVFNITNVENQSFKINTERLNQQFSYFIITNQIIGFFVENLVPIIVRKVMKFIQIKRDADYYKINETTENKSEIKFLNKIREELLLPEFNVDDEYRELIIQFGYLILFGPIWSLAPIIGFINDIVEIKTDFYKLVYQSTKPIPIKSNSITPWENNFKILIWLGSLISPSITVMFRNSFIIENQAKTYDFMRSPITTSRWYTILVILIIEHASILFNFIVNLIFSSIKSKPEDEFNLKKIKVRETFVKSVVNKKQSRPHSPIGKPIIPPVVATVSTPKFNKSVNVNNSGKAPAPVTASAAATNSAPVDATTNSAPVDAATNSVPVDAATTSVPTLNGNADDLVNGHTSASSLHRDVESIESSYDDSVAGATLPPGMSSLKSLTEKLVTPVKPKTTATTAPVSTPAPASTSAAAAAPAVVSPVTSPAGAPSVVSPVVSPGAALPALPIQTKKLSTPEKHVFNKLAEKADTIDKENKSEMLAASAAATALNHKHQTTTVANVHPHTHARTKSTTNSLIDNLKHEHLHKEKNEFSDSETPSKKKKGLFKSIKKVIHDSPKSK